jgi:hypothetical protein
MENKPKINKAAMIENPHLPLSTNRPCRQPLKNKLTICHVYVWDRRFPLLIVLEEEAKKMDNPLDAACSK